MKQYQFLLLSLFLVINSGLAQNNTPFLERKVTITLNQERLDEALKKIADQCGFTFSYNTSVVDADRAISYSFRNQTVRQILDEIFEGTVDYKVRSKYLILTKAKGSSKKKDEDTFAGYVIDEATGERIKNATIYDPVTLTSTITDSYGYFELKVDKRPSTDIKLSVNKENYSDTVIAVVSGRQRLLNIPIKVNKNKITTLADSVEAKIKRFLNLNFLLTKKLAKSDSLQPASALRKPKLLNPNRPELLNIKDTIYRTMQMSFVPFIGTNHALSGNVINDFSFNILGGYSLGVQKFELGGLFNIDRGDVRFGQIAGLYNVVGGTVNGVQIAGLFNTNYGFTNAVQIAGLLNVNFNSSETISIGGLINMNKGSSRGFHLGGLGNITVGDHKGPQVAGLYNIATKDSGPFQLAGLFNATAHDHKGSQIGGLFNFTARDLSGSQVAGLWNFTGRNSRGSQVAGLFNINGRTIKGSQVSGLFNYGKHVNGSQVGLLNFADSVKGITFGLLSFVSSGYHKLEISADEVFYVNVAFRTGVRKLYNIITAGARPNTFSDDSTLYTFGYGIGTAPRLSDKLYLNFDLTANQIMIGDKVEKINLLNKFYLGVDWQATKWFSITAGATLNGHITDTTYDLYPSLFTDFEPRIISDRDFGNDLNLKMWWGGKVGIRFF
ncbi:STN and carboxypeptidase regulatory-like domain-containing protein [Chryseosolibacter indicus]|uniref:STN domain-containing protein n=1 Tax=Chryseosolibacter indicus TaxID=2782351 RepID=A0ABS5VKL8_9BACT|nr:STN and carboxypeptidase regulatory-like domain-containing protein [Chryseosolibacter indicus]MBT1701995.1 STN domain-containing protein [Chryseosolibacter indicus]